MTERYATRPATENVSTVVVSLSLYLIILAFFILMNAISRPEGVRAKGVLDSIGSTFKSFPLTFVSSLEMAVGGAGFDAAPGFEESIRELFETSFPLVRITPSPAFNQIEVVVPLESLFAPGEAEIQGKNEPVLDRLAKILGRRTPGVRLEIEVLISPPPVDAEAPHSGTALMVDRAGALARELAARGVPAARISAGIEQREPDSLRILFVVRQTDEPIDVADGDRSSRVPVRPPPLNGG